MSCGSATTPSSSISRISSASAASARSRTCSAVERAVAAAEQRRDLRVEVERPAVPGVDAGLARLDQPARGSPRRANRSREGRVQRLGDVQRDGRADQLQQHERGHRQAERRRARASATSSGVPSSTAS